MFEGSIKDAAAFEALVKKASGNNEVQKDGEWTMIAPNDRSLVAWNSSKFAVINDMPFGNMNPMMGDREEKRFGTDSLKVFVKQVMTLDNDESLFDDERFASVMKETGDMHVWFNAGSIYSDMTGMMSMMKAGSLLEGNVMAGAINFEDGKITGKMKQFYGKEMQKAMDKWKWKKVDAAVLDRIPSDNVIGVVAMNIDPEGLKEFLKAMGLDGFMNMFLAQQNITADEIFAATKGDFVIAVTDLQMKDTIMSVPMGEDDKMQSFTVPRPDMNILFATTVNQKASFDKLLNLFKKDSVKLPFTYQLNNDWFVASNKPEAVSGFLSGKTTPHAFTDKISGHYGGMYIDIQRLLKTNFTQDPLGKSMLAESAAVWKDLVAVGNEYKDGVFTSEIVVNMVDDKTNSLKQINQYIEKMNVARKANKMAFDDDERMPSDTSSMMVMPPPPPAVDEDRKQ